MSNCSILSQHYLYSRVSKDGLILEASDNFLNSFQTSLNASIEKIIPSEFLKKKSGDFIYSEKSFSFKKLQDTDSDIYLLEDVSSLKTEALNLKKGQETLREAQALAHLGSWEWDITTGGLVWSDEIYRIFGLTPQEFGASYEAFLNYIHPDDRQKVIDAVNNAVSNKAPYGIEHRVLWQNGTVRSVYEHGRVYYDDKGKPIRMLGVVHDITDRKLHEQTLKDMNSILEDKVVERTFELRSAQDRLIHQAKLASVGTLTAGIAHEIKNPLNIIKGGVYIAEKFIKEYPIKKIQESQSFSELGEFFKEDLIRTIQNVINQNDNIERINGIIVNMMGMIQNESTSFDLDVSINQLITEAANLALKSMELSAYPKISYDLDSTNPKLTVNRNELTRVIINIVENALHAVKDVVKPELFISTRLTETHNMVIKIKDNGSGISEENKKRIFEPFFTTKPVNTGTGLGLYLCYNIIKNHGGDISVESQPEKGTTFVITLKG